MTHQASSIIAPVIACVIIVAGIGFIICAIVACKNNITKHFTRSLHRKKRHDERETEYVDVELVRNTRHAMVTPDDDRVAYATIKQQSSKPPKLNIEDIDASLNLDTLLIQIKTQVTPKWYQLGIALKINNEILDKYSQYSDEESIVEVLDHWLRNSSSKPTWRAVATALNKIELYELEGKILKVYETGKLPFDVDSDDRSITHHDDTCEQPPPIPPKANVHVCT